MPTRFGPETRFDVAPVAAVPFRVAQETELERLKARLLREYLNEHPEPGFNGYLRRAANEAAALAWMSPFPLLVFPTLFEEKAEAALRHAERQAHVRLRTAELMTVWRIRNNSTRERSAGRPFSHANPTG
ncbi:MAG TPA: hypothetical protein PLH97_15775 [Verrucomicrobiota bacterium]|nr:hypothetical protein [Verrucomicrobiota bacterium]